MARMTTSGCLCRVPLFEASVPPFRTDEELYRWAASEGVEIAPDHLGRASIPVSDAYRLFAEADQANRAHQEAEAARIAAEKAEVAAAQVARQDAFVKAYTAACGRGKGSQQASQVGWEAVRKIEQRLPSRVTDKLAGVRIPTTIGRNWAPIDEPQAVS